MPCCCLCGVGIWIADDGNEMEHWLSEFRVVFTQGFNWETPQISGVGCYQRFDSVYVPVPTNSQSRYDDPGMSEDTGMCQITLMEIEEELLWGYPFHEACWKLLVRACHPLPVDINLLFACFRSHGITAGHLNWDFHSYTERKGLTAFSLDLCWYDPRKPQQLELVFPEAKRYAQDKRKRAPSLDSEYHGNIHQLSLSTDPLSSLPLEIRDSILCYLPSKDVCSARLASRAFSQLVSFSPSFWFTRFFPRAECGFMFEAMDSSPMLYDWKVIYLQLRPFGPLALTTIGNNYIRNRKRVWFLATYLSDVLFKLSQAKLHGTAMPTYYEPETNGQLYKARISRGFQADDLYLESKLPAYVFFGRGHEQPYEGKGAGALVVDEKCPLSGCRRLYSRSVKLPRLITGLFVSTIDLAGHKYVSGIRFVDDEDHSTSLGYIRPGEETWLEPKGGDDNTSGFSLHGFKLAIDDGIGIRAFAMATKVGRVSSWAGDPKGQYQWLVPFDSGSAINTLNADFDAYKLVRIFTPDERQSFTSLRISVPWMPTVPPHNWYLNESSYRESFNDPLFMRRFLSHAHFGGKKGAHLSHVAFLAVWVLGESKVIGIEIGYDTDDLPNCSLGQCTYSRSRSQLSRDETNHEIRKLVFDIDGPNGEYMTAFYGSKMLMKMNGDTVYTFKFNTNFNRTEVFPPPGSGKFEQKPEFEFMGPEGSTTITGFYTEPSTRLSKLWVISEDVDHTNAEGRMFRKDE